MSGGFGICGHRNSYNSGVRNGNWVEDLIGNELANVPARGQGLVNYTSENHQSFIHPTQMPDKASRGAPSIEKDPITKVEPLPYDMMFKHGIGDHDESKVAIGTMHNKIGSEVSIDATLKRTKELAREQRLIQHGRSEYSSSIGTAQQYVAFKVRDAPGAAPGAGPPVMYNFSKNTKFSQAHHT